jgi:hypothetical protein
MQAFGEQLPRVVDDDAPLDLERWGPGALDSLDPIVETPGTVSGDGVGTLLASAFASVLLSTGAEPVSPVPGPVTPEVLAVVAPVAPGVVPVVAPVAPGVVPVVAPGVVPVVAPGVVPVVAPVAPGVVPVVAPVAPGIVPVPSAPAPVASGVVPGVAPVPPGVVPVPSAPAPVVPDGGVEPGLPAEEPVVAGVENWPVGPTAPWASALGYMTAKRGRGGAPRGGPPTTSGCVPLWPDDPSESEL